MGLFSWGYIKPVVYILREQEQNENKINKIQALIFLYFKHPVIYALFLSCLVRKEICLHFKYPVLSTP